MSSHSEAKFLANIQKTFNTSSDGRHYNDVEFSVSDGSKLGANKFLLASQSEYFHAMFYGGLRHEDTVALEWCSKKSLEKILCLLSVGKVDLKDLDLIELVELMDATRLMGLKELYERVEFMEDCLVLPFSFLDYSSDYDYEIRL